MLDIVGGRRPVARDLYDYSLITCHRKGGAGRQFGIEASRRKSFQLCLVELVSIAYAPCAGDNRRYPVVTVRMGGDFGVRRHSKHDGVNTWLVWIAFKDHALDAGTSGASCSRIALARKLVLGRGKTFFRAARRSLEKSSN